MKIKALNGKIVGRLIFRPLVGLNVSGLVENLAQNFLETYKEQIERWRKM